jgi:hypothetical protein
VRPRSDSRGVDCIVEKVELKKLNRKNLICAVFSHGAGN